MDLNLQDIQNLINDSLNRIEEDKEVKLISFISSFTSRPNPVSIENIIIEARQRGLDEDKVYNKVIEMIDKGLLDEKKKGYVKRNI